MDAPLERPASELATLCKAMNRWSSASTTGFIPARPNNGPDGPMTQRQQNSADAVTAYRAAMAGFLKSSLVFMGHTAGPQTGHSGLDADTRAELERDPFHVFRLGAVLLVRKARLHVIAVLAANRNSNLHSLAVQMRPALECAGQVVSIFHSLFIASDPDSVGKYLNADYLQTMQRHTKGQLGRDYLLESIAKVDPLGVHRKHRRLHESAKVQSLEGGLASYDYLSRFHHPKLDTLRGPSFLGGVSSNNTRLDQLAFAALLDYLAHQMLVMVAHAALSPTTDLDTDPFLAEVFARLAEKRTETRRHRAALASIFPTTEAPPQD